jgi:predicted transcriptional regulator of viral defense system
MQNVDGALAAMAAKQHALITVSQAEALGLTRSMRRVRLRTGTLVLVDRGVLRVAGAPVTWESTVLAAVLAAGPGAVASHRTAAVLWGLETFRPGRPEVTIPRGRKHRRGAVTVHESTDLDRCVVQRRNGIPVTDPARTLLDVALRTSDARLFQAIESARRSNHCSWKRLIVTLLNHARRGRPGVQRLRRVIAQHLEEEERTDSAFEALFLSLLLEFDLPRPALHHRIFTPGGDFVAEVDLAYPELMILIELDGQVHDRREVADRDAPRQNRLELLGWTVLRYRWRQFVDHPDAIVREIKHAIDQSKP